MKQKTEDMRQKTFESSCRLLVWALFLSAFTAGYGRTKTDIGAEWKFAKTTAAAPSAFDYDDSAWETVAIPHTWNATDAQDGGSNYARTVGWYRKTIAWDPVFADKRVYIEVQAASLQAECFVNGVSVGTHRGGYNAFRFDVTNQLNVCGDNVIAIKVDNRTADDIAPLSGDFSVIGGIYRNIYLIVADPLHVDLDDSGSNGLYLTTTDVSTASAKLEVKARVVNSSAETKTVNLKALFRHPEAFEAIAEVPHPAFDVNAMKQTGAAPIETLEETAVTIPAGEAYEFKKEITVNQPHLWDGKTDPYRYQVDFTVSEGTAVRDAVSDYVGFRFFHADNTGFYLNGRLYPLRGVNRHQDWEDKGYAISRNEHNIDFGMIYEIGANAVRMAHYPQDPYFHELFDKYGIVVWVEIPFVDKFGSDTTKFLATTRVQLREMIRQRYNRPSILMWGLQNEVSTSSYDAQMSKIIPMLHAFAKAEDPSRLTVQAQAGADRSNWTTDLFGKNQYPGWYQSGTAGSYIEGYKNKHLVNGVYHPVGLSEYGAGGNIDQHEVVTKTPNTAVATTSQWHPEEYQSRVHEQAIRDFSTRTWIWGTFLWNMFDFASDGRNEGDRPGINDKGLVTHNRKTKKDSFYAYKANWSHEPTLYIASRRFVDRQTDATPVTVYTNGASVELFVNGVSQGSKEKTEANCGILTWNSITLPNKGLSGSDAAKNVVVAKTTIESIELADTVVWNRILSNSTELSSVRLLVDNVNRKITLLTTVEAAKVAQTVRAVNGATFVLVNRDGLTPVTEGNILPGMKLNVTAEDGVTTAVYEFIVQHIALNKPASADATENTENTPAKAVDGNLESRWAAPNNATASAPHWWEVDLGKNYILNEVAIQWFNSESNPRTYRYLVTAKKNGETTYNTLVDRSNNDQPNGVTDLIADKAGRYVRIKITGTKENNAYNYPSIYEVQIYGWAIESTAYTIHFSDSTIDVPDTGLLIHSSFLSNITFSGNETHRIESAAYYIVDGDRLIITDVHGKETPFTIRLNTVGLLPINNASKLAAISNTNELVHIQLLEGTSAQLHISDVSGKKIVSRKIGSQFDCSLPKGIYLIEIKDNRNNSETVKYLLY
jgi:hypothetical protein